MPVREMDLIGNIEEIVVILYGFSLFFCYFLCKTKIILPFVAYLITKKHSKSGIKHNKIT